ncbi:MAG: glycoside hydrolase family 3 N-terminal domain-containing protein [Paracoccus sp. (in: a-proteobacteria)]|uniref:glycoside hydrolase family 3 N-terminal domain-containing protein n=1 Tax=Paracoccus sp. TaxID=267 RepID=UPI0026DED5A2|nr:glycoside hydrolase family 3 N-terminal domain-containing protein [Paracoccus sp. (in: a-proteobacteria)]MDO5630392.1 glycoside hydrolase family 3 N-terminal domain-containing protein [Paracoccus sp. (in: a-proteobacteria)]
MTGATILGGIAGTTLTPVERDFFRSADPWGFILFGRNVENPDQLRRLTAELRNAVGRDAVITIDQEGGRVQRLRAPHWRDWPAPLDDAARGERVIWLRHRLIGAELRAAGIDSNCAPTLDVAQPETHPFLRNRCLGTDPETVARLGRAAADGLLAAGVLPVMKHMPGHGRATADSHLETPQVTAPLPELDLCDFAPFRALADLPIGMTAHIRFTAITDQPATAAPQAIALIRDQIGFDGLLMTDDIGMNALSGTQADRARAAIAAGCDLVLHCNGDIAAMEQVAAAAGPLSAAATCRADAALAMRRAPDAADLAALAAEYDAA